MAKIIFAKISKKKGRYIQKKKKQVTSEDYQFRFLTIATFFVIGLGVFFYHYVENFEWLDALYFSIVTLTTVGYGDFTPETDIGKIFTIFYILIGLGIIYSFINTLINRRVEKRAKKRELKKRQK